jgi:hypothetical protein
MKSLLAFLAGKKTYIICLAWIVYGVLAYYKVAPGPDQLAAVAVGVGSLVAAARSALSLEVGRLVSATATPVIDPTQLKELAAEVKTVELAVMGLVTPKAVEPPVTLAP